MRLDAPIKELTFTDGHTLKLRKDSIVDRVENVGVRVTP